MNEIIPLAWWQALLAVVDQGGYAQAAEFLGKSQSAVSYSIQRLEDQLGLRVFRTEGRRAVPTPAGAVLLQRARLLVDHARSLESSARELAAGRESLLRLAVDALFPEWLLLRALATFSADCGSTRIEVLETVLSGTDEALVRREADLAVTPRIPQGFSGEPLLRVRFVAAAAPDHPLHALGRPVAWADLRRHRQLVVRASGTPSSAGPSAICPAPSAPPAPAWASPGIPNCASATSWPTAGCGPCRWPRDATATPRCTGCSRGRNSPAPPAASWPTSWNA